MCYSGKCRWEGYMGDCMFPCNKEIREKYPYPVCEIGDSTEEEQQQTQEAIQDILTMLKNIDGTRR